MNLIIKQSFRIMLTLSLWLLVTMLQAQERNLKTELLVYILPDSLELQTQDKSPVSLDEATIKSATLDNALKEAEVTGIARAFPDWQDKDSLVTRHDGEVVKMPPFYRIFILTFETEAQAVEAISILEESPAVVFAEKHSQPVPDNDYYHKQWYLNNDGTTAGSTAGADINAEGA